MVRDRRPQIDQLATLLGRQPRASAAELAAGLRISVATVHRWLAALPAERVLTAGRTRRTRYALRRPLRGEYADLPLYAVDAAGRATFVANLALLQPQGMRLVLPAALGPVPEASRDGWWDGLPYPLQDMRPQGYLGRQLARAYQEALEVSPDPPEWSDDDVIYVLSRVGSDVSGNLVLGDAAYRKWLADRLSAVDPIGAADVPAQYAQRAEAALRSGWAGSSAAGEFPKFAAARHGDGATPHVLVKFSGAGGSAAERRWADLLICEHLALRTVASLPGVASADTRVIEHAGRTFLESERFDRQDLHGRLPVCTLDALNADFLGASTSDWTRLGARLHGLALLEPGVVPAVEHLWWFSLLIANSDMHLGNLSFHVSARLRLAPAYDVLPMAYAPLPGGEVPVREFRLPLPVPAQRQAWLTAAAAATAFWKRAGLDLRISEAFRVICAANGEAVERTAEQV